MAAVSLSLLTPGKIVFGEYPKEIFNYIILTSIAFWMIVAPGIVFFRNELGKELGKPSKNSSTSENNSVLVPEKASEEA
jgi:hypothetical protein